MKWIYKKVKGLKFENKSFFNFCNLFQHHQFLLLLPNYKMISLDAVLSLITRILTGTATLSPKNKKILVRFCATTMAPFLPPSGHHVLKTVDIVLVSDTDTFREAARYDSREHRIQIKNPLDVRNSIPWMIRWVFIPDWDLHRSVRMFLLVLIHEMTHAWQATSPYYKSLPWCQMEAHANYVTLRVAIKTGLEDDYEFGWTLFDRLKRWKFLATPFFSFSMLPSEDDLQQIEECYRHLPRNMI